MATIASIGPTYAACFLAMAVTCAALPMLLMIWHTRVLHRCALQSSKLGSRLEIISSPSALLEATEVILAAWAGSKPHSAAPEPLHDWIVEHCVGGARTEALRWMVRFYIAYARICPGGTVFGARAADGTLAAVAVVVPYLDGLPHMRSQTCGPMFRGPFFGGLVCYMRCAWALLCSGSASDEIVRSRFRTMRQVADDAHAGNCPSSRPHLHIGPIAVKPAEQGRKYASALMRHISGCADTLACACYVECSDERLKAIFSRFGYRPIGNTSLKVRATQHGQTRDSEIFDGLLCMERPIQWPEPIPTLNSKYAFPPGDGVAVWTNLQS